MVRPGLMAGRALGRHPKAQGGVAVLTVLLVDDSPLLLSRVAEALADVPDVCVVGEATTLAQSLQLISALHPDVVVADLHLPDGDGRQVLAAAKRELPTSHVLILTNYTYPPLRQSCLALGADAFVDKSSEFEQVSAIVGGWSHAA